MGAAVAGGSGGGRDPGGPGEHLVPDGAADTDVERVRQPELDRPVELEPARQGGLQSVVQMVAQSPETIVAAGCEVVDGESGGGADAHGEGNIFGAGA